MPHDRPPSAAAPGPHPHPWEDLERLAAGELTADEAATLRARIESDEALAQAFAEVTAVHDGLDALPLHAVPLGLLRGVMR